MMAKKKAAKKAKTRATQPKSRIVAAVGTASAKGGVASERSRLIEAAMSQAVLDATAEGISIENSKEIKKRMMAAREKVLAGL